MLIGRRGSGRFRGWAKGSDAAATEQACLLTAPGRRGVVRVLPRWAAWATQTTQTRAKSTAPRTRPAGRRGRRRARVVRRGSAMAKTAARPGGAGKRSATQAPRRHLLRFGATRVVAPCARCRASSAGGGGEAAMKAAQALCKCPGNGGRAGALPASWRALFYCACSAPWSRGLMLTRLRISRPACAAAGRCVRYYGGENG